MNTNLTVYPHLLAERGSKFKGLQGYRSKGGLVFKWLVYAKVGRLLKPPLDLNSSLVFIFKWLANLRDLSVLEDPLELNSLYAHNSSEHQIKLWCRASCGGR